MDSEALEDEAWEGLPSWKRHYHRLGLRGVDVYGI
jgi:hypothetical protein